RECGRRPSSAPRNGGTPETLCACRSLLRRPDSPPVCERLSAGTGGARFGGPLECGEWLPLPDLQRRRLARGVLLSHRGALLARFGIVRFALFLLISGGRRLPRAIARLSAGKGASVTERLTGEVRKLPPKTWPMIRMHWSDPKCFETMADYLERLPENVATAVETGYQPGVPTILLTAHNACPDVPAGVIHRPSAKSGHWLQLDEPDLVINAILELLRRPTRG